MRTKAVKSSRIVPEKWIFLFLLSIAIIVLGSVSAKADEWKINKDGTYSYYDENGKKVYNAWTPDKKYYLNSKGIRQTGWMLKNKKWYFFERKNGTLLKNIWIYSGKKHYYAGDNGVLYTGGRYKIKGYVYAFSSRGVRLYGKQKFTDKTCYFDKKNGRMVTSQWIKINNAYYYFGSNGAMKTNQWVGSSYYVGSNGARLINTWKEERYLGSTGKVQTGLQKIDGVYYYLDTKTGKKVVSTTIKVNNVTYKFDSNGKGAVVSSSKKRPAAHVSVESTYTTDPYVDDDTLLASIIYCEAGNQKYTGKLAVGMVIMNRLYSNKFSYRTLAEVIYAKNQFTPARDGSLARALKNPSLVTAECKKAAAEIQKLYKGYQSGKKLYLTVNNKKTVFSDYLFFMTKAAYSRLHLHSAYTTIQDHVFFKVWS